MPRVHLLYCFLLLLVVLPSRLYALDVTEIIKKIESNLNGDSAVLQLAMKVTTKRGQRTIRMKSYSVGTVKSFIQISYPKKDAGITFLKIDNTMWQYVPRIEKIIKIPSSMMLQSWMGSDFSNDDLVRESSLSRDYTTTLVSETEDEFSLQLIPLEDAPVVWGKIMMQVSKEYYLPTEVHYFDEDEEMVRILEYSEVKKLDDRYYPTSWTMTPLSEDKKGHQTLIEIGEARFNTSIDPGYFTKQALKRYAR